MSSNLHSKGCRVFVGNIPYDATEDQLTEIFAKVGPVIEFRLVYDKETRLQKGYGFCEYRDAETALSAMRNLQNVECCGRSLRVDWADNELRHQEGLQKVLSVAAGSQGVGNRIEQLREREMAERASLTAQDAGILAIIAQLMQAIDPAELVYLLGIMQKFHLEKPDICAALLNENPQLTHAMIHSCFLIGLLDDTSLPLSSTVEDDIRSRSKRLRDTHFKDTAMEPPKKKKQTQQDFVLPSSQELLQIRLKTMTPEQIATLPDHVRLQAMALKATTRSKENTTLN